VKIFGEMRVLSSEVKILGEMCVLSSEVKILGEMCVLSLMHSYVAVCMFCAVRCVTVIGFYLLFSTHPLLVPRYGRVELYLYPPCGPQPGL